MIIFVQVARLFCSCYFMPKPSKNGKSAYF